MRKNSESQARLNVFHRDRRVHCIGDTVMKGLWKESKKQPVESRARIYPFEFSNNGIPRNVEIRYTTVTLLTLRPFWESDCSRVN